MKVETVAMPLIIMMIIKDMVLLWRSSLLCERGGRGSALLFSNCTQHTKEVNNFNLLKVDFLWLESICSCDSHNVIIIIVIIQILLDVPFLS